MFAQSVNIDPAYLYLAGLLAGAGGVIAFLYFALIASKDKEASLALKEKDRLIAENESLTKAYKGIAAEAIQSAREMANYSRQREGKEPIIPLTAVVPEGSSPPNKEQRELAELQSMRASMAQIKLAEGLKPRVEEGSVPNPQLQILEQVVEKAVERVDTVSDVVKDMVKEAKDGGANEKKEGES